MNNSLPDGGKGAGMRQTLERIVKAQLRRAITLGAGALVGAGMLNAEDVDGLTTVVTAVLVQCVLTIGYAVFDNHIAPRLARRLAPKETE